MPAEILTHHEDHTLILTLSNPEAKNALAPEMYTALMEAISTAGDDAQTRAIILTGANQDFCAGGNLNRLRANRKLPQQHQFDSITNLNNLVEALRACGKPVIAAVEGAAAGAGFSIALACDFLVAAENAKFVMAYVKVALSPDGGGSWQLSRALPRALAAETMMLGKPLTAAQLQAHGLLNRISASGQALSNAKVLARELATLSPRALGRIKELLNAAATNSFENHLALERDNFVQGLFHDDAEEGISAFLEKRPAKY